MHDPSGKHDGDSSCADHDHHHTHEHEHGRDHAHGHAHGHGVGLDHEHELDADLRQPALERGAGVSKILFLDAFSGVAGDMTIAALLDLGIPLLVIENAVAALPIEGFHLHRGHRHRSGIVATAFDVHVEAPQPERSYREIDAMLEASGLAPAVKALARRIFRRLGKAEAHVHRTPIDDVHFHEVGAVDAIVDIVGAAAAFEYLGASVIASPLPMGRGFVKARHGVLPLPAPATVTCLEGVPTYAVDLEFELVTPTGAAIVAEVATGFTHWPRLSPQRTGFGAGTRELPDRPNLLRAVLGSAAPAAGASDASTHAPTLDDATHVVLEANVDDATGELTAHAIEALLAAGALDAWATPVTMKKGRPGLVIAALARAAEADVVAHAMLRETTSIGVRKTLASRIERPRRVEHVKTPWGEVRVKVSEGPYGPPLRKPEFDDCARLAKEAGVPVREVIAAALAARGI